MKERWVKPELELYHPGMYWVLQNLISQGLLTPPCFAVRGGFSDWRYPTPQNVMCLLEELPPNSMFEVLATGPY